MPAGRALWQLEAMPFIPAHRIVAAPASAPEHTAYLVHGILGSMGNWRVFARRVVERHPAWRVVLLDLRNHGLSGHPPGPHTVEACAADVLRLASHLGLPPDVVWGHSFGGKVALLAGQRLAGQHPAGEVREVWLLDSHPGAESAPLAGIGGEMGQLLAALRALSLPAASRRGAVDTLRRAGLSEPVLAWMSTNLRRSAGGYVWRFELSAVEEMLRDYLALDAWPELARGGARPRLHVLWAERNERWSRADLGRLRSLEATGHVVVHRLVGAGHWVHVDNPDGLLALVGAGLRRRVSPLAGGHDAC